MKIGQKVSYLLIIFWFRLVSLLPLKLLFLLSEIITFLVYRIIGYRRKVVVSNLENSFPDLTKKEINKIARKYFRHMSVMIVENIYMRFVPKNNLKKHLVFENPEVFEEYFKNGQSVIVMLGHFGNWEFGSILTQYIKQKGAAVYKELTSPVFDKIYFDIRKRLGVEPVEMKEVFRKVVGYNKEKDPYVLFMVADQSPLDSEIHNWVQFLNQPTGVFTGSEKLARKFNMPVLYLSLLRTKKGSYRAIVENITDNPTDTIPGEITAKYFQFLEESIKDAPRFWLWSHRRWKHKPPADVS